MNSILNKCESTAVAFANPLEHLNAELRRLDFLLHREILRLRASYQLSLDEFRGLYISDEQVDHLVNETVGTEDNFIAALTNRAEELRIENQRNAGSELPWPRLVETFQLSSQEQDLLLLALAPELDLKYETLYAYLNNDVTRKWPTCELMLRVLAAGPDERMLQRSLLLPQATLFEHGILRWTLPAGDRPQWLAGAVNVAPAVINFLLNHPALEQELAPFAEFYVPERSWRDVPIHRSIEMELRNLTRQINRQPTTVPAVLVFEGRAGSGRRSAAEAFARDLSAPMLTLDLQAARASGASMGKLTTCLLMHQRLYGAVVCLTHGEVLLERESNSAEASVCLNYLACASKPVVVSAASGGPWRMLVTRLPVFTIEFSDLPCTDRASIWQKAAAQAGCEIDCESLEAVADRFVLTPGQIQNAVTAVARRQSGDANPERWSSATSIWLEAARSQSDQSLGQLAAKVRVVHGWRELVLPPSTLRQLRQITGVIRHRRKVYEDWGFEQRVSTGKGLMLLFSGPSGTGKTMTAGVMAQDLGLDLYKIDLSCVVSKYIGETEKNLDRIFRAALCSNAILLFDEADALFGKRSEVKDAHDRYANVEVAYLLQKLEEHDGAVILATNLSKNIDEAFARRMHYVVRFPLPDAAEQERLWRGMFPPQTPLAADIDFEFLSTQFSFTGGDIKNVALDAAFRAAADGSTLTMRSLVRAVAQQLLKEGRAPSIADFRHYHALLREER